MPNEALFFYSLPAFFFNPFYRFHLMHSFPLIYPLRLTFGKSIQRPPCTLYSVNFFFSFFAPLFLFFCLALHCGAACEPSAETLLQEARLHPTAHPITLSASIRGAEHPLPLTFKVEKGQIQYQLHDPEELIVLALGPNSSSLSETKQGARSNLNNENRYHEIRDTGVTYDDLSLGFFYWPHPRLAGTEKLRGTTASIVELMPPPHQPGPYGSALLWIDQASGAPLRMEGRDPNGQLIKRFEVISAQKINGLWTLKEMRIENFDPKTHVVTQRRYLDISRNTEKAPHSNGN